MRRLVALAVVLVAVPAAVAAPVRTVAAPAPVTALAADGVRIAYATGFSARDCNRVYVWNTATRGVSKLGRRTHCQRTSTGNAIAGLAIAGNRVLWVHYVGGNTRDWSLWTATTAKPSPIRLRLVSGDADAPAPVVVGEGDASPGRDMLPYAVDRTVVALRSNGARRFAWTAPARVVGLAAGAGQLAVASEGGTVTVLDASGRVLRREEFGSEISEVRLARGDIVVQHGRTLELRGKRIAMYSLVAGARLADAEGDRAAILRAGKVSTFDLDSGSGGVVAPGAFAQLESGRLGIGAGRTVSLR